MSEIITVGDWVEYQISNIESQISTIPQLFTDLINSPHWFFCEMQSGKNELFAEMLMLSALFVLIFAISFIISKKLIISAGMAGIATLIVSVPTLLSIFASHLTVFENVGIEIILLCILVIAIIGIGAKELYKENEKQVRRADFPMRR